MLNSCFPLVGLWGSSVDIFSYWRTLAAPPVVKTSLPSDKQTSYFRKWLNSSLPFFFRVGDLPELLGALFLHLSLGCLRAPRLEAPE